MFVYFLSHKTNWNFSHVLFSRTVADFMWDLLANFSTCWQRSICIILCAKGRTYSIFELVILVDDSKVFFFSCAKVLLHCENELSKMVEKTNTHTHYENGHTKTQTHAQSQFHFESFHTLTLLLFPFLLLHRTKYWGSSTNCHFELSSYMYIPLYRIYILRWVMKKSVPKELSNLNFSDFIKKFWNDFMSLTHFFRWSCYCCYCLCSILARVRELEFTAQFVFQAAKLTWPKAKTCTYPTDSFL